MLKTVIPPLMVKEGGMESVQLGASLGRKGLPAGELLGLLWAGRAWGTFPTFYLLHDRICKMNSRKVLCAGCVSTEHSQGLPCYGLEAWMRSGSPACSCITNWSIKGWNAAQRGSEIQDRHACVGAASKPRQKGGAGEGNLIKGAACACLSPLPRRQGWGWDITLFTCSFCFQLDGNRYLLFF